ncbi:hypothetical protein HQH30_24740 [Escherichia coli]|nr:hypothetical protein [Escherichia coli]
MPAFEWVHVQLHQQKGMISLSPPTICNSAVLSLWFELVTKIDLDIHKKNRYASYDFRRKIEMQHEEFQKMTEREQVPLLKLPE